MDSTCNDTSGGLPFAGSLKGTSMRLETPGDADFLLELYTSTRQVEMDLTGWSVETRRMFIAMQFRAMRSAYAAQFPSAKFSIVLQDGLPVGRMVVNRDPGEIRIVDLALMPGARNLGIGGRLLRELTLEASQARTPLRLHVLRHSRAINLYHRLGFVTTAESEIYRTMEWQPSGNP